MTTPMMLAATLTLPVCPASALEFVAGEGTVSDGVQALIGKQVHES
jgi:hypothetical protein